MGSRLRDYIRVFDDVISPEDIQKIRDFYKFVFDQGFVSRVNVPEAAEYYFCQITGAAKDFQKEGFELHKYLAALQLYYFSQYQQQLGIQHQSLFSRKFDNNQKRSYVETFFLRAFYPGDFCKEQYDAHSYQTANRFLSSVLFLTDEDEESFVFDNAVVAAPIRAKAGRLIMFPSNWQYVHRENPFNGKDIPKINIYGHYNWYNQQEVENKLKSYQQDINHGLNKSPTIH